MVGLRKLSKTPWHDPEVPYEETLGVFEKLLKAGKVRAVGTSNLDPAQLASSLEVAREKSAGAGVAKYLDAKGERILSILAQATVETGSAPSEVALDWLIARPRVTAPIANATSRAQGESLFKATRLTLTTDQIRLLDRAGE